MGALLLRGHEAFGFQLIRFNPIGREKEKIMNEILREAQGFQLIRFNPIGRDHTVRLLYSAAKLQTFPTNPI